MTPLLTDADVAALLVVSRKTVQRPGSLPGLKVGRQWRFRPERIAEWLAAHETTGQTVADIRHRHVSTTAFWGAAHRAEAAAPSTPRLDAGHGLPSVPSVQGYTPVFGHLKGVDGLLTNAASQAAGRGRAAKRKEKAV